jgi:hypothetical protein
MIKMKLVKKGIFLFSTLALSVSLFGSSPTHWTVSTQADFLKGDFKGVSVTSDGKLLVAPGISRVLETGQALAHSAVVDKMGIVFIGTGSEGKIFRLPLDGEGREWADLDENGVFGLAVDSMNELYAGTSPEGPVYRLDDNGKAEIFFEPKEKFIWDLAFDRNNNLFVATGPKGIIYKVSQDGSGEVFYDSPETHIVSLSMDRDGNLLAGSSPGGIIYRISSDGKPEVVYDSALAEIKAMTTDRYGVVYAIGLGSVNATAKATKAAAVSTTSTVSSRPRATTAVESTLGVEGADSGKRLEVYKIDKSLLVDTVYSSDSEVAFDLMVRDDGTVLVATGTKGRVLAIGTDRFLRLVMQSPDEQVTQLVQREGAVFAVSSNLANLYRLAASSDEKGVYESDVLDAGMLADWGRIRWSVQDASGSGPQAFSRSGNTAKPDDTWSDWAGPYPDSAGSQVQSAPARYLQWKMEFPAGGSNALLSTSNSVERVQVSYLQRNVAPLIKELTVHSPGAAYFALPKAASPGGAALGGPNQSHLRSLPQGLRSIENSVTSPPRRGYIPGARSFSWKAQDANKDDLLFTLSYRAVGERNWKTLERDFAKTYYTLDGRSLADGRYEFRVEVSDRSSNPTAVTLTAYLVSKEFVIANGVPAIEISSPQVQGSSATLRFSAQTTSSPIFKAEYSLDGGVWEVVYPVDGISDSEQEEFELALNDLSSGEHVVTVRVVDGAGNIASGRMALNVN